MYEYQCSCCPIHERGNGAAVCASEYPQASNYVPNNSDLICSYIDSDRLIKRQGLDEGKEGRAMVHIDYGGEGVMKVDWW